MIQVENLKCSLGEKEILKGVSLEVKKGEFVGIIGPNGAGKSTLIRNICNLIKYDSGSVFIDGSSLSSMTNREVARKIAIVLQEHEAVFDFTVDEVMQMSRYPHKKMLDNIGDNDEKIIKSALKKTNMLAFVDRSFLSLSGGEKQRVLISRALAQETDIIVLDEPTNHLDIGSQLSALNLFKNSNKTILAALHDLTVAAKYCDRIYVIRDGSMISDGVPEDVITSELIYKLYDIDAEIVNYNNNIFINYR